MKSQQAIKATKSDMIADQIAKEIDWDQDLATEIILRLMTEVNMHKEKIALERALSQFDESEGQEIEFSVQLKLDKYTEKNKDLVWEMATSVMAALVRQMKNDGFTPDNTDACVEKIWITSGNHFSDVTDFSFPK